MSSSIFALTSLLVLPVAIQHGKSGENAEESVLVFSIIINYLSITFRRLFKLSLIYNIFLVPGAKSSRNFP